MGETRRHDVLLLDFGGVCLVNPVELHRHAEDQLGLAPGTFTWLGPIAPETDALWRAMVAGDGLTERQYWAARAEQVGRAGGVDLDLRAYMRLLYEPPRTELIRPGATLVAEAAKAAGLGVSVLTNDLRAFHGPTWGDGIEFLQLIDHLVDCSDTGILKPDPAAFARAVDIVGCPADRILFVDDLPLNVQGGVDAGLDGLWFDIADVDAAWVEVGERLGLDVDRLA